MVNSHSLLTCTLDEKYESDWTKLITAKWCRTDGRTGELITLGRSISLTILKIAMHVLMHTKNKIGLLFGIYIDYYETAS